MENKRQPDLLDTQPLQETDEELTTEAEFAEIISEEEKEELKNELAKLEDEIVTLRQVLAAKEKHLAEIKHKLGVSMMNELKQNFSRGWHDVQTHSASVHCRYKKTQETLSQAGIKASTAITNVGSAIGKKLGDMRNSPTFKSFEERVENTVTSLKVCHMEKAKVGATNQTQGSFEEVLSSTAHASAQSSLAGSLLPEADEELQ
ncbi:tumor protein D53 isoform X6 [Rana temporaria]|uniref:tumor protein D53 isoform X6 n=1 Tax=Rana temporaria TaxID=8407 RepID=UPI001AADC239|nr:tumor protein D53 isoform X6 [Rana temporaria]